MAARDARRRNRICANPSRTSEDYCDHFLVNLSAAMHNCRPAAYTDVGSWKGGTMEKASRHVIVNLRGGWSVYQSGKARATRVFETQRDAVKFGRSVAKKEGTDLYVHR